MRLRAFLCTATVLGVLSAAPCSSVFAALLFQDTFTKADQALLGTTPNTAGGNWAITGTSVVNPIQIVGNQVPLANTGQDAFAPFLYSAANAAGFPIRTSVDINLSAV